VERNETVQGLIDLYDTPSYLEIGVNHGLTFNSVRAARKVAVDPKFNFDVKSASSLDNTASFYEVTSDVYFADHHQNDELFDVIFLDGLHTFDQTLRDLMNAVAFLKPGGAILIDDTVPASYAAALPDIDDFFRFRDAAQFVEHSWMGDVFRLVFFIRDYLPSYSYATILETHGQTVVWKQKRRLTRGLLPVREVACLEYAQAMIEDLSFKKTPFLDIVGQIMTSKTR